MSNAKADPRIDALTAEIEELEEKVDERSEELAAAREALAANDRAVLAGNAEPGSGTQLKETVADLERIVAHLNEEVEGRHQEIHRIQAAETRQAKVAELVQDANRAAELRWRLERVRRETAQALEEGVEKVRSLHAQLKATRNRFLVGADELAPRFRYAGETINNLNRNYERASQEEMRQLVDEVEEAGGDLSGVRIAWARMDRTGDQPGMGQGQPFVDPGRHGSAALRDYGEYTRFIDERAGLNAGAIEYEAWTPPRGKKEG